MNMLLNPAATLMNRLKYPQKFALISLLFVLPLGLVMTLLTRQISFDTQFAQRELSGSAYLRPLVGLFADLLQEQLLATNYANGETALKGKLEASQAQIDQDFLKLREADARFGDLLKTTAMLDSLEASWRDLKANTFTMRARQSIDLHARQIADTRRLIGLVGDTSYLILDPRLDSYYAMDAVLLKLPEAQDLLAQVRLFGRRVAAQGGISPIDKAEFSMLSGQLGANIDASRHGLDQAFNANPAVRSAIAEPAQAYLAAATAFLEQTRRDLIFTPAVTVRPEAFDSSATQALQANFALWDGAAAALGRIIQARVDQYNQQLGFSVTAIVIGLALSLYFCAGLYASLMRTVSTLDLASKRMVRGNFSETIELNNRDELGHVARSFNEIATALLAASAQHQAVFDNAADAMITFDEHGTIRSFNPAATQIFGYCSDEAIGRSFSSLVPSADDGAALAAQAVQELAGQRKDGASLPLDLAVGEMRLGEQRMYIAIVHDLTERRRIVAERARLQEEIINAQAAALAELSTPLIPISEQVLAMPLVGSIDARRAEQVVAALLHGIERTGARVAILDITGVTVVDTQVAKALIAAARSVRLLGAQVVLTGIQPEVAQTLVGLGAELSGIVTRSTLQSGIAYATSRAVAGSNTDLAVR